MVKGHQKCRGELLDELELLDTHVEWLGSMDEDRKAELDAVASIKRFIKARARPCS